MRVTQQTLEALNRRFANAEPLTLLRFAHATFGARAAILTGMQRAGTTLCHMADRAALGFDVLFVDTGVLHAETRDTRDALAAQHPHLRLRTLHPAQTFAAQTKTEGLLYLSKEGQERCCELRKSLPLREVRQQYDALIGALRSDEGGARAQVQAFGLDLEMSAIRIHPFASFSRDKLDAYIEAHPALVQNPLHSMGFATIGCFPCTGPVRPEEPERAGRWRHLAGVEYCGINPIDRGASAPAIDLDDRYCSALL